MTLCLNNPSALPALSAVFAAGLAAQSGTPVRLVTMVDEKQVRRKVRFRTSCNPSRKTYAEDVPTILRERGFRFFFYMADRFEPPHVHVQREDCAAKLWLDPLEFAFVEGFRRHEANEILHITEQHRDEFLRAWYKAFGDLSHE